MDITITLGLTVSILVHAAATIWWASRITGKVERLERDVDQIEKDQAEIYGTLSQIKQSLARLEERNEAMISMMQSLEKRIK
jgi:hypothetical protein